MYTIDFMMRRIMMALFIFSFTAQGLAMSLLLTSSAFQQAGFIPRKYTCDGEDLSPALTWRDAPAQTNSFVLIVDDPDAPVGMWDHWLLFNLPATVRELPEGVAALPAGTQEGVNSWGRLGYGGPCPPDKMHRYFFKLYALDTQLDLPRGVDKAQIEAVMLGHVLAQTELMGKYDRAR